MTKNEQLAITKYDLLYEGRMTRVETALEGIVKTMDSMAYDIREIRKDMKTDFRWILGMMVLMLGGFGSLFGLMAHGFKWF